MRTAAKQFRCFCGSGSQGWGLGHLFTHQNSVTMPGETFSRLKKIASLFQGRSLNVTLDCLFPPTCASTSELRSSVTEDSRRAFLITVLSPFCPRVHRMTHFPMSCVYSCERAWAGNKTVAKDSRVITTSRIIPWLLATGLCCFCEEVLAMNYYGFGYPH